MVGAASSVGNGRARRWATIAGGAVAVFALHAVLVQRIHLPTIYADEHGPFELARTLLGNQQRALTGYYPGHAFALLPAVVLGSDAHSEYRVALYLQCAIAAGIFAVLGVLADRVCPDLGVRRAALAAAVAVTTPYLVASTSLVWAEITILAVSVVTAAAVVLAVVRDRPAITVAAGAVAGCCLFVHPRLIVLAPAGLVPVAWCGSPSRRWRRAVEWTAGAGAGVLLASLARRWIAARYTAMGTSETIGEVDIANMLQRLDGRLLADVVATLGVPVLVLCSRRARAVVRAAPRLGALVLFAVSYTLAQFGLSGIFLAGPGNRRIDYVFYGRYQAPATTLLLFACLLALASVSSADLREDLRSGSLVRALIAVVGMGCLLGVWVEPEVFGLPAVMSNIPHLALIAQNLSWIAVTTVAVAILLLTTLVVRSSDGSTRLAGLLVLSLALSVVYLDRIGWPQSAARDEDDLVPVVASVTSDRCVATYIDPYNRWNVFNYEFFADADFVRLSDDGDEAPPFESFDLPDCVAYLLVSDSLVDSVPEERLGPLVGVEAPTAALSLYELRASP